MKVFVFLAFAVVAIVAGLAGVFSLVHGRAKGIDRLVPEVKIPAAAGQLPKYLEPVLPAPEPAQAPTAGIHKCVNGGRTVYTDQPCTRGQAERALDPSRSRIVTLPAQTPVAVSGSPAPSPTLPSMPEPQ